MIIDQYQRYIHLDKYSHWRDDLGRRETWKETVDRYCDELGVPDDARQAILEMRVMPSMRALWAAGFGLRQCHMTAFNCAYQEINSLEAFAESVYISMCGCGDGFSVERQVIAGLPEVPEKLVPAEDVKIHVEDSRQGWASAFKQLITCLYDGAIYGWDLSQLRPAGAVLKTSGGRSSGPAPLDSLFRFTVDKFMDAKGRKLTSIEIHDIVCKSGQVAESGGSRRTAKISLSNLSDDRMRRAKHGNWHQEEGQRAMANNSAVYDGRPDFETFLEEWQALFASKSGERGIFNRKAAKEKAKRIGREVREFGTNPCGEVSLRDMETCNLSEVVVRADDSLDDLLEKVRLATILGTIQSTLTDFKFVRPEWKKNAEEERLLGVSLTGIMDHYILGRPQAPLAEWLVLLRRRAWETNREWAAKLGINPSKAITTVKPSGTVSKLVNCSSGIHARYAHLYVNRVVGAPTSPVTRMLLDQGMPHEPKPGSQTGEVLFMFAQRAPASARTEVSALEQCQLWKMYNDHWADHSVSCTVSYTQQEFLGLGQWVWDNFDSITGLSFMPKGNESSYEYLPLERLSQDQYEKLMDRTPEIDWSRLSEYEHEDNTTGAKLLACAGGSCDI